MQDTRRLARGEQDDAVRPRQYAPQDPKLLVVELCERGYLREIGADERQRLIFRHSFYLVQPIERLPIERIASERVHGVGRIADHLAFTQRIHGAPNLAWLRMLRMHLDAHAGKS